MTRQENNGKTRGWLKLSFACPRDLVEAASDLLIVSSEAGVEQSPERAGRCGLAGFFPLRAAGPGEAAEVERIARTVTADLAALFALYHRPAPTLTREILIDEDWSTSWRQHFRTSVAAPGLVIKPSWEDYTAGPGERVLEMDPGMAFGTGQHASTRLALGLIRALMPDDAPGQAPRRVLDLGTGTGILAMAAALWGADEVLALDNDPEAVRTARENVAHNGLADRVTVAGTPLVELVGSFEASGTMAAARPEDAGGPAAHPGFDLIVANIVHDVLAELCPGLTRLSAPGAALVLAGILAGEQERDLVRLYEAAGFVHETAARADEWAALRFRKPGR